MYLGNGPFGDNVVSVFWNMNTYLNQRHFLFSIGITLFVTICLITVINKPVPFRSRVFLGVLIGLLPFWNSAVYIATLIISFGIGIQSDRKRWASYIPMVVPALLIALPQIVFIGTYTQHAFKFNPGFLVTDSFVSWLFYWVRNFGISLVTVPLGIYFSTKKSRILVLPFLLLFLVANLFQFSFEMASNHKFINMMILFANLYSAFCIVFLWKHGVAVKIVTGVFLFFLIVSGVLDLLVVKNDVKATIVDYPGNPFMSWVVNRTKPTDIFVTNGDIYDPVTISGRKTTTGRAHTAFTYGIDTKEDVLLQREVLEGLIEVPNKYIAVYVDTHIPTQQIVVNTERLRDLYQTVYADTSVTVYHK